MKCRASWVQSPLRTDPVVNSSRSNIPIECTTTLDAIECTTITTGVATDTEPSLLIILQQLCSSPSGRFVHIETVVNYSYSRWWASIHDYFVELNVINLFAQSPKYTSLRVHTTLMSICVEQASKENIFMLAKQVEFHFGLEICLVESWCWPMFVCLFACLLIQLVALTI